MGTLLVIGIFFVIGYFALFAYSMCVVAARADKIILRDHYLEVSLNPETIFNQQDYVLEES